MDNCHDVRRVGGWIRCVDAVFPVAPSMALESISRQQSNDRHRPATRVTYTDRPAVETTAETDAILAAMVMTEVDVIAEIRKRTRTIDSMAGGVPGPEDPPSP